MALLFLFVVLPFAVAGAVLWFVSWRHSGDPPPIRTSDILASGDPASAEIVAVKTMSGFLDAKPMIKLTLRVTVPAEDPFELEVVQSVPRGMVRDLYEGAVVEARVTPDRAAGAVVLSS